MQNLPRPALKPMAPALIGRFLMTELPGKSRCPHFQKDKNLWIFLDQQNHQLELRCLWLIPGVPAWNITISGKVKMSSYRLSMDDQCCDLSCQELRKIAFPSVEAFSEWNALAPGICVGSEKAGWTFTEIPVSFIDQAKYLCKFNLRQQQNKRWSSSPWL